jgi:hypothetical protein
MTDTIHITKTLNGISASFGQSTGAEFTFEKAPREPRGFDVREYQSVLTIYFDVHTRPMHAASPT